MMTIGEAAKRSDISAKMIRYYEQIGLVPAADRTTTGYRMYSDSDVHTLRFVRRARDLGFAVEEIKELLALWQDRRRCSGDVKALALGHVEVLQRKIEELSSIVETLQMLADSCSGDDRPECPILADLSSGAVVPKKIAPQRFGATSLRSTSGLAASASKAETDD